MAYSLLRPLLFRLDPETAHRLAVRVGARLGACAFTREAIARFCRPHPSLTVRALGLDFPSPLGVAAGFDKNGLLVPLLDALGFGFVEVGTVTPRPWGGNPRPRIFRLPADEAIVNRMGLPNGGAAAAAWRLRALRGVVRGRIGVNVGRVADGHGDDAVSDYVEGVRQVAPFADYICLNVSCPNTDDGRAFDSDAEGFDRLIAAVAHVLADGPPWVVKLSPDLEWIALARMLDIALARGAHGFVVSNTTRGREGLVTPTERIREIGPGGLSGRPLAARACALTRQVRLHVGEGPVIISVGGIFDADDAQARLDAGATLLQMYTGIVYGGPLVARRINQAMARP